MLKMASRTYIEKISVKTREKITISFLQYFITEICSFSENYPRTIQYCSVIHFLVLENVAPNEIHRHVTAAYNSEVMPVQAVRKWCHQFKNGWTSVFAEERTGQSISVLTLHFEKIES